MNGQDAANNNKATLKKQSRIAQCLKESLSQYIKGDQQLEMC